MTEQEAKNHIAELKKFYGNLTSYCITIPFLVALNLFTSPGHWWFVYPMLGWGFGLLGHASKVFPIFKRSRDWEKRKLDELMRSDQELVTRSSLENLLEERSRSKTNDVADPALKTLIRRIEHLEAIVTSKDWDNLPTFEDRKSFENPTSNDLDITDSTTDQKAANLARRVR